MGDRDRDVERAKEIVEAERRKREILALGTGSFNSLFQVNEALLNEGTDDDGEAPSGQLPFTPDTTEGAGAPTGGEDKATFRGFNLTNRPVFEQVVNWIIDNPFGGEISNRTQSLDGFVNAWAIKWREEQGLDPDDSITRVPSLNELLGTEEFLNGASWLPITQQAGILPPLFRTLSQDEEGNDQMFVVRNDPLSGLTFIEEPPLPPEPCALDRDR